MATHIEMKRLADDATAASGLARLLLCVADAGWTDWEIDFLEHISRHRGPDPLSTRQTEVLFELRAKGEKLATIEGLVINRLIAECWLARLDLDDGDFEFVTSLHYAGKTMVNRPTARRLLALHRKLQPD